jgi:DNA-directed RNA polymerase specialized sigma24 family protein
VHDPFDEVELSEDGRQMLRALTPRQRAAFLLLDRYDYDLEGAEP